MVTLLLVGLAGILAILIWNGLEALASHGGYKGRGRG